MKSFESKKEVFDYIKRRYSKCDSVLIKGSSIKGNLKDFSDIDVEFYQNKPAKPEYELILVKSKIVLITAYPYKAGKKLDKVPKNVLLLKGDFYEAKENHKEYIEKERVIRNNQMFIDSLFKYLRRREKKQLKVIKKYGDRILR